MLTASFIRGLESQLGRKLRQKIHIRRISPISGGSINHAARIDTTNGVFFLKANDAFLFPGMFEKEARGLQLLREPKLFTLPDVIMTGDEEGYSFLLLKFIESRARKTDFWESFGTSLAKLHRHTSPRFGLTEDNYIGSMIQSNREHNRWPDFFREERIDKQMKLSIDSGKLNASDSISISRLFLNFESIIPEEPPALLHGDLWSGNFISGLDGEPCLIDPAIYYGHREMDLAMTRLFGGFEEPFYEAYNNEYPLSSGFEERVDIHNLYPLLVHVNLFGGEYISRVRVILKKFN
jgi:fructosamine-3-kinase